MTTIILANRSYQILKGEFASVRAGVPGRRATDMLNIDRPDIGCCRSPGRHAKSFRQGAPAEDFGKAIATAMAS